jgi:phage terminase, large subunit, PBSX family
MSDTASPTIDLRGFGKKINTHFIPLFKDKSRIQVLVGGASSSKSYSTGQKYIYKCIREKGHKILVVRKVAKTLRHSVFDLMISIINDSNMRELFKYNSSELMITCLANGNQIIFTGLDDVEKLKSIHGITDIWVEEASEISESDFNQLDLRLRGETLHKKTITLTLNPISIKHWIKKRFFDRKEADCITHRSTYKNNEHLDADTIKRLEGIEDKYFRDVYVLGNWGIYGNVVFSNYEICDFEYTENDLENVFVGMDFGYVHAQAIERAGFRIDENDPEHKMALYVFDELYEKNKTNEQFIEDAIDHFGDDLYSWEITADCAYPAYIIEWQNKGFKVEGSKKGKDSVKFGIEYLTGIKIYINRTNCSKLAEEIPSFKRREDKNGEVTEDFVSIFDDGIAALRYGSEYIWSNQNQVYYTEPGRWSLSDLGL